MGNKTSDEVKVKEPSSLKELEHHIEEINRIIRNKFSMKTYYIEFSAVNPKRVEEVFVKKLNKRKILITSSRMWIGKKKQSTFRIVNLEKFLKIYKKVIYESVIHINLPDGDDSNIKEKSVENESICPICFESDVEISLSCTHSFCQKCINTWKEQEYEHLCPICRGKCIENEDTFFVIEKRPAREEVLKNLYDYIKNV